MVTTTCKEIAGVDCTVPLSGSSAQELEQNVFAHGLKDHAEMCAKMTPQQQDQMKQKIREVYGQKTGTPSRR